MSSLSLKKKYFGFLWILLFCSFVSISQASASVEVLSELGKVEDYRFSGLEDLDIGPDGTVYVTDANHHAVKAFAPNGENVFSIANAQGDGTAQFDYPIAVARDLQGRVWVADYYNHRLQRFSGAGVYDQDQALVGGKAKAGDFRLDSPEDVVLGPEGNYWIADYDKDRIVVLSPQGRQIRLIGPEVNATDGPTGLDFDTDGHLWVVDHNNNRLQQFDAQGDILQTFGEYKNSYYARIGNPRFVTVLADGSILASHGHNVSRFSPAGLETLRLGDPEGNAGNSNGTFDDAAGLALDSSQNIYVVDRDNHRVQKFDQNGEFLLAFGEHDYSYSPGKLYNPEGIAVDSQDQVWVVDSSHNKIQKFDASGEYLDAFGEQGSADGQLNSPNGICIDPDGFLWISDDEHRIQKFSSGGVHQLTLQPTDADNNFILGSDVGGMHLDGLGYLWVADRNNGRLVRINPGNEDDYTSLKTGFNDPWGLDLDSQGRLWVANTHEFSLPDRKLARIDPDTGHVLQVFSEIKTHDQGFLSPSKVITDSTGFWVLDGYNRRVLHYSNALELTHKIGGYYSNLFSDPQDLALAQDGSLWIADFDKDALFHFSPQGIFLGTIDNTTQSDAELNQPTGVALYTDDQDQEYVLVCDQADQLLKFTTSGAYVGQLSTGGQGAALDELYDPWGLRIIDQTIFVCDSGNDRVTRLNLDGGYQRAYCTDGGAWGKFFYPVGLDVSPVDGRLWVADRNNDRLLILDANGTCQGLVGGPNNGLFFSPHNVHVDANNQVWVSDLDKDHVAQLDAEGNLLQVLGGYAHSGALNAPACVQGLDDGGMWITDTNNHRLLRVDAQGNLVTLVGEDGTGQGQLKYPQGLAVTDSAIFVADTGNDRIQRFSPDGTFESVLVGPGAAAGSLDDPVSLVLGPQGRLWEVDQVKGAVQVFSQEGDYQAGVGPGAVFAKPWGLAFDPEGHVWVSDTEYHQVSKYTQDGTPLLTLGKTDKTDGSGQGEFDEPRGLVFDSQGRLHVADYYNNRVQVFAADGSFLYAYGGLYRPQGLSAAGEQIFIADSQHSRIAVVNEYGLLETEIRDNGNAEQGFDNPRGMCLDASGMLWIADSENDRLVRMDPDSGQMLQKITRNLDEPIGLQLDAQGQIWTSSHDNNLIFCFDANGTFLSAYDNAGEVFDKLRGPSDIALASGVMYIADHENHRIVVRDGQGQTLRTFGAYGGAPGLLNNPQFVALGPDGTVWVSEVGNDRISVFTPEGIFLKTLAAGGDLPGLLEDPTGLDFDSQGRLWIAEASNDRIQVFDQEGQFQEFIAEPGDDQGKLDNPQDLFVGQDGRVYLPEFYNNRVSVFSESGAFLFSFGQDQLSDPRNLSLDDQGHIWVADDATDTFFAFDLQGNFLMEAGGYGSNSGQFKNFGGIAVDAAGTVWTADRGNDRLQVFSLAEAHSLSLDLFHRTFRPGTEPEQIVDVIAGAEVKVLVEGNYTFDAGTGQGALNDFLDLDWNSSDPQVATVDSNGLITALAQGEAQINVSYGQESHALSVTVWPDGESPLTVLGGPGTNQGKYEYPQALCLQDNTIYIADDTNHRIKVLDLAGNILQVFYKPDLLGDPDGLAVDENGNIYVTEDEQDQVHKFAPDGTHLLSFGEYGQENGQFDNPFGITLDHNGTIWVVDRNNHRLQQFQADGTWMQTLGGSGSKLGQLSYPAGIAVDAQNRLHVTETGNDRISVFETNGDCHRVYAYTGDSAVNEPHAIFIDPSGFIWITDEGWGKHHVKIFDPYGDYLFQAGSHGAEPGLFDDPGGLAFDGNQRLWVADSKNDRLQVLTLARPETLQVELGHRRWRYGNETEQILDVPPGATVDVQMAAAYLFGQGTGEGHVEDFLDLEWNSTDPLVAAMDENSTLTALALGSTVLSTTYDGLDYALTCNVLPPEELPVMILGQHGAEQGRYRDPGRLCYAGGTLYVADNSNKRVVCLDQTGNILKTIANPELLDSIQGLAVSPQGTLYVADHNTDMVHAFGPEGLHLFSFGGEGDGDGKFNNPRGMAIDNQGNLWVTDQYNHRLQQFDANGTYLSQFGTYGSEDQQLNAPWDVVVDANGDLWVASAGQLKKFQPDGSFVGKQDSMYTRDLWLDVFGDIWVRGNYGTIKKFSPDFQELLSFQSTTNEAEPGQFDDPQGIAVDAQNRLWVVENDNHRLQRLQFFTADLSLSSPKTVLMDQGQVTATASYLPTAELLIHEDVSDKGDWFVSDAGLASVDQGMVAALDTGKITVSCTYDGQADSLDLNLLKEEAVELSGNIDLDHASKLNPAQGVYATINSGEKRYFQLTPENSGYFRLLFSSSKDPSNANIALLDDNGTELYKTQVKSGSINLPALLKAEDYYLQISGWANGEEYLLGYTQIQTAPYAQTARPIQPGGTSNGTFFINKTDRYELSLRGPSQLNIAYETNSSVADMVLTVYPEEIAEETTLDQIFSTDGENVGINIGLAQGTYYLEVKPQAAGWYSSPDIEESGYTLSVSPSFISTAGEFEPNNTPLFANSLTDGETYAARNYSNQDDDYFTFHYVPDSDTDYLTLDFTPQDSQGSHTIDILNLEEQTLKTFYAQSGEALAGQKFNLPEGQYYLLVTDNANERTEYQLALNGKISPIKKVTGVSLTAAGSDDVQKDDTLAVTATVYYSNGDVEDNPAAIMTDAAWSTTDPGLLTVSPGQALVNKAAGNAIVTASLEGKIGKLEVNVGGEGLQGYGNLLVVAGGGVESGNKLKDITQYLCDMTYQKFQGRGFEDEDIYYLNPVAFKDLDGNGFNDGIVDQTTVNNVTFAAAISEWATNYPSTGPLYIYLNDHGANQQFQLYPGQILSGGSFNALLEAFQTATGRPVVILIEACHSGTFVTPLQAENRVIITSTDEDVAYLGDGGSASFSQFFIGDLYKGASLSQAFAGALASLVDLGNPYAIMNPQFTPQDPADLDFHVVGDFALAPMFPEIDEDQLQISSAVDLSTNGSLSISVPVTGVDNGKVWATIRPAGYAPPAVGEDFETPDIQLPSIQLPDADAQGPMDGIFSGEYSGFVYNGLYEVVIFARDSEGNLAQSSIQEVSVSGGEAPQGTTYQAGQDWNLFGSNQSFNAQIQFADSGAFASVWKWGGTNWSVFLPDGTTQSYAQSKGFGELTSIDPGDGFWVNCLSPQTVTITGQVAAGGSLSLSQAGWYLLGLKGTASKDIANLLQGAATQVDSVWKWKEGNWAVYLPGEDDFGANYAQSKGFDLIQTINAGEGFWINCNAPTTLN